MTIMFAMLYLNFALAILSALFLQSTTVLFHLLSCIQILSLAVMYQAVYPTCLVLFMKNLAMIGIKFNLLGSSLIGGFADSNSNAAPDYKFERIGYMSASILQ